MPLQVKPVRMKNSLYLLIPKGISELLEIDENRECTLTAHSEDGKPVLRYAFSPRGGRIERERSPGAREGSVRQAPVSARTE